MNVNDETARLWRELKTHLIRTQGREGAAEFMAHAARTLQAEAKRTQYDAAVFRAAP